MSHPNYEYMKRHLAPLVGCIVTEIVDAGEGFTSLVLERGDERFECMLTSDMELGGRQQLWGRHHWRRPPLNHIQPRK